MGHSPAIQYIYRSICMGTDFLCKSWHTRILLYNFYLYPVGFFLPSKQLKLIYQCSRELIMSFLTGRSYVQIHCKENRFGALVRAPCWLSVFWHFFSKRNTEIKYFQKYVPHGVPWGMCYLTATYSLADAFFNKKLLNKHNIICSAKEKQIIPIPFTLCDCYIDNQTTACFLSIAR